MRRIIIVAVLSFFVIFAYSQTDNIPTKGGYVELKERIVDVGKISGDSIVTAKFTLYNKGDEPVSIIKIFSSCNCAVPSYNHDNIAPGDSTHFEVKYDPRGYRWGEFRRTFQIRTTAENSGISAVLTGSIARKYRK